MIATVFGHTHENLITPFARPSGGGLWGIESPSHVDWPIQSRLIEVMENGDGTPAHDRPVLPGRSAVDEGRLALAEVPQGRRFLRAF